MRPGLAGDVADRGQIVADEKIGRAEPFLQVLKQPDDPGPGRHIGSGNRLVRPEAGTHRVDCACPALPRFEDGSQVFDIKHRRGTVRHPTPRTRDHTSFTPNKTY